MDLLVFPNQLFEKHPGLDEQPDRVVLIEDSLFFGDYHYPERFHPQKLRLLRAAMKKFESVLQRKGQETVYLDYDAADQSLLRHLKSLQQEPGESSSKFLSVDPVDHMLEKRLRRFCRKIGADLRLIPNPGFLNSREENEEYRAGRKRWFMADFYKWQRQRLDVLMDGDEPVGGQWSFDEDNRKKVPRKLLQEIPALPTIRAEEYSQAADEYVRDTFPDHWGRFDASIFPTSHNQAQRWLEAFLEQRFCRFGDYEDAIVAGENSLWHAVLTPALNVGLLTPRQVLDETLDFLEKHDIPLNSAEGFIRQIIGWREFMRATYEDLGVQMRNSNHWEHHRPLPRCFYDATTGIEPLDDCLRRVIATGYCHHIERLMILGGFMFLCEIDPHDIYRWFMEMFVDSYDWVMVPNVYAMSQHADGGLITTKPYFSGSSYVKKMSNHSPGPWCETWDGLYWRWIWKHRQNLARNPRWAMMCKMAERMDAAKRDNHLAAADAFLDKLDQ